MSIQPFGFHSGYLQQCDGLRFGDGEVVRRPLIEELEAIADEDIEQETFLGDIIRAGGVLQEDDDWHYLSVLADSSNEMVGFVRYTLHERSKEASLGFLCVREEKRLSDKLRLLHDFFLVAAHSQCTHLAMQANRLDLHFFLYLGFRPEPKIFGFDHYWQPLPLLEQSRLTHQMIREEPYANLKLVCPLDDQTKSNWETILQASQDPQSDIRLSKLPLIADLSQLPLPSSPEQLFIHCLATSTGRRYPILPEAYHAIIPTVVLPVLQERSLFIRPAFETVADWAEISEVDYEDLNLVRHHLATNDSHIFFVQSLQGVIAGYIRFTLYPTGISRLNYLYIDDPYRSKGLSHLLISCFYKIAEQRQSTVLTLGSSLEAIPLFLKWGFRPSVLAYEQGWEELTFLQKIRCCYLLNEYQAPLEMQYFFQKDNALFWASNFKNLLEFPLQRTARISPNDLPFLPWFVVNWQFFQENSGLLGDLELSFQARLSGHLPLLSEESSVSNSS